MVNQSVSIKDKYRVLKKVIKIFLIIFVIALILLVFFTAGFLFKKPHLIEINIVNPIANLILKYTGESGEVNKTEVIREALIEFNQEYINYLLAALGTGYLHNSVIGGNPRLELVLGNEVWSSEIVKGVPDTKNQAIEKEDIRITISKEEAINAILSDDVENFMQNSVTNGNTRIELIAGKTELFSKGYLDMYNALTKK
jgi:hypothetical protein